MHTRSQTQALRAYEQVAHIAQGSEAANFRRQALSFPVRVLSTGLSQATGFLMAKQQNVYLNALAETLAFANGPTLHTHLLTLNLQEYQHLSRQALEAASWLKRYAQALIAEESAP